MIYRDINVLTTPLLYYIGLLMFRLFGTSYLTYRIYNLLITIFLYTSIYILFKKINISKTFSILYTSILFYFFWKGTITYGANYNVLALAITLSGIIISIDKYVSNKQIKYYNSIQGIITFLIIFTKQNIGLYYLVSNILAEILINKKDFIKNILKQLGVIILLGSIYLAFNNSLYAFIDYTILGMKEFITKNKIVYINYFAVYILMLIYIIVFLIKTIKENNVPKAIKILIPYAISYLLIAFPILEIFHSLIAGIPLIITFVYCIHISLINDLKLKESSLKFLIFTLIFLVVRTAYLMYSWTVTYIKEKDSIYHGAVYVEEEQEGIKRITNYIKESKEKVIILCPEAGIYNMPLGIDNGILDLPVQGNVGKNGAQKIIQILSNLKETKILLSEEKIYWQEYDEVREYVIKNSEKIDSINGAAFKYNIYILNKK